MNDLVSIIVPIYNVEKYLKRCIDSIINQTYTNIEIILVDDGSPDNCGKICDEYAKKDNRIVVIHQENKGLSGARNSGTLQAKGKYITYIDSDDYVELCYVEKLYNLILDNDAHVSGCGFDLFGDVTDKYSKIVSSTETDVALFGNNNQKIFNGNGSMYNHNAWGKIIKTELARKHLFPNGKIYEDLFFWAELLQEKIKIVLSNENLYHYYVREDSIQNSKFNIKKLDLIDGWDKVLDVFIDKQWDAKIITNNILYTIFEYTDIMYSEKKFNKEYCIYFKNQIKRILKCTKQSVFIKTMCYIYLTNYRMFIFLNRLIKKLKTGNNRS